MQVPIEALVSTLYSRVQRKAHVPHSNELNTSPSLLFGIAIDVAQSLGLQEQEGQLARLLNSLHVAAVTTMRKCAPAVIMCAAALTIVQVSHVSPEQRDSQFVKYELSNIESSFNEIICSILSVHSTFSNDFKSSTCYAAAQLILRNCCHTLLRCACDSLELSLCQAKAMISTTRAVEILSWLTTFLVDLCPIELSSEAVTDPLRLNLNRMDKAQREERSHKSLIFPKKARERLATISEEPKIDPETTGDKALILFPSLTPPNRATRSELENLIISCCFTTLSHLNHEYKNDVGYKALLCRRVLIPLLLLKERHEQSLLFFEPELHQLLETLYTGGLQDEKNVKDENEESRSRNRSEVLVLIAALFDFLFRRRCDQEVRQEYRYSPFLWRALRQGFWDALTLDIDAGRRANMQLRVEYLLKRIVHLTHSESPAGSATTNAFVESHQKSLGAEAIGACALGPVRTAAHSSVEKTAHPVIQFHEWFIWDHDRSFAQWEQFFLILDVLKEFGLHIVEPALVKLDAFIEQMSHFIVDDNHENKESDKKGTFNPKFIGENVDKNAVSGGLRFSPNSMLHPVWVEVLFLKLILHPNIRVRKLGLRRLWRLPLSILKEFSSEFLFHYVFQSSSDPRLCSDLDRIPNTAAFLESFAFEGAEEKTLRNVEPLIQEVERFYTTLFTARLRSTQARSAALYRILDTVSEPRSRFTTMVLIRTLHTLAHALYQEAKTSEEAAQWTISMILDSAVLGRLSTLLLHSFRDNVPFWLSVRVTCIVFSTLLTLASIDPATFRLHASFWSLLCLCGPLGKCNGHQTARLDGCGRYGRARCGIDVRFLAARVVAHAKHLAETELTALDMCDSHTNSPPPPPRSRILQDLLQTDTLFERTSTLLTRASAYGSNFDAISVKQHFFLIGALLRSGNLEDVRCAQNVLAQVVQCIASYRTRAYSNLTGFLTALSALIELHHEFGTVACSQWIPLPVMVEIAAAVNSQAFDALMWGWSSIERSEAVDFSCANGELNKEKLLLHTSRCDLLAAAIVTTHELVLQQSPKEAAALLKVSEWVDRLSDFIGMCGDCISSPQDRSSTDTTRTLQEGSDVGQNSAPHTNELLAARHMMHIVLVRNAACLLQSNVCGLVYRSPDPGCLAENSLQELMPEFAEIRCFLRLNAKKVFFVIRKLTGSFTQPIPPHTPFSEFSDSTPHALLADHARCVYDTISILCECVIEERDVYCSLVQHLERFAMNQVGSCWTDNLAAVYDILVWVTTCPEPDLVDHATVLNTMFAHIREVGAREHARVSFAAFSALHHVMPHHPTLVEQTLKRILKTDVESERLIFFASTTASLQVLGDPHRHWPYLKDTLLYIAVFFNPGREEEENESTMAITEPLLWLWPEELREVYPPAVHLATLGRALAISTILYLCAQNSALAETLCWELIHLNTRDPVLTHEPCMPNSRTHRVRLRLWQLLCAMLPLLPVDDSAQVGSLLQVVLRECVPINNLGSVRRLIELFVITLLHRLPTLSGLVVDFLGNYNLRPQACGTYLLIACYALLHEEELVDQASTATATTALADSLLERVVQQCTSNQYLLRIISHIGLYKFCHLRKALGRSIPKSVSAIFDYIEHAEEHIKFRVKYEDALFYNTAEACTPRSIFCVVRKDGSTMLRDSIPASMFERIRFLETETCCLTGAISAAERLRWRRMRRPGFLHLPRLAGGELLFVHDPHLRCLTDVFKEFAYIPHTETAVNGYLDYTKDVKELLITDPSLSPGEGLTPGTSNGCEGSNEDIQKKATSWWNSEVYDQLHPRAAHTDRERQSLVVVASLLENPVNVAGLCRCGEIFAVEKIIIREQKVFEHPHFVATARSAELWIPWQEVKPKDLLVYLASMQREGYTVVGVEQTSGSVSIANYEFPSHTVVVLGSEGHGIPAAFIPLLDICIEIPQYGLIRSLNVHVTGAIAIYEYTRQHLMKGKV